MAKVKLTKKEADRIMKVKGNVSGAIFGTYYQYIFDQKGYEGVKIVERRLAELNCPIELKKFSSFGFYPESQACLTCLVILEVFNWDEGKAYNIGYAAPMYSIITKLLMKYISIEKMFNEGTKYWGKHFDFGEMKCTEYDQNKGCGVLRLNGFKKFHPIVYTYIEGYLAKIFEMTTASQSIKISQSKSLYKGDFYDEYKISWK